jgi:hypothetical protein
MKKLDKLNTPVTDDSVKEDFEREKIDQVKIGFVLFDILVYVCVCVRERKRERERESN